MNDAQISNESKTMDNDLPKAAEVKINLDLDLYDGDKGQHECNVCGKPHVNAGSLIYHKKLHHGEKHYECDDCGKRFVWKS